MVVPWAPPASRFWNSRPLSTPAEAERPSVTRATAIPASVIWKAFECMARIGSGAGGGRFGQEIQNVNVKIQSYGAFTVNLVTGFVHSLKLKTSSFGLMCRCE